MHHHNTNQFETNKSGYRLCYFIEAVYKYVRRAFGAKFLFSLYFGQLQFVRATCLCQQADIVENLKRDERYELKCENKTKAFYR